MPQPISLNETTTVACPVCESQNGEQHVTTRAFMHEPNDEKYIFRKCNSCDCVFLTNPVQESRLHEYYTNNYLPYRGYEAWGKYKSFVENSQKKIDSQRALLVSKNTNKKSFSLLDVGCGNPSFLNTVHEKFGASCTGIDFSDFGWKDKKKNDVTLVNTSIYDFNPNRKFDVITLWHYLEHDYNLIQTADQLYQLLEVGGKLIIEVPDYRGATAKVQKQYWQGWHSPRHLTLFSGKSIQKLFSFDKWSLVQHNRFGTLDAFTLYWLGKMERKNINWSGSMESEFWPLVFLKIISSPLFLLEKLIPLGVQVFVIEKKQTATEPSLPNSI